MLPPINCFSPHALPCAMFGERTTMPRTMPGYSRMARPATSSPVVTIIFFLVAARSRTER
jgi:hypothetical protein